MPKPRPTSNPEITCCFTPLTVNILGGWGGRRDLNPRQPDPQSGALTRLSYGHQPADNLGLPAEACKLGFRPMSRNQPLDCWSARSNGFTCTPFFLKCRRGNARSQQALQST